MPCTDLDRQRLLEALALAQEAIGLSDPNPRVGCIIGHADGRVLGRGHTQQAGGPHAEVMALRDAAAAGQSTRGATAWVTLEPCAHHGRTPPCCDALIEAGVARVVVAVGDPFAQVAGAGMARLRAAGIEVVMGDDTVAQAARELNLGYFHRLAHQRPWVRLKTAMSIDGRTALPDGRSQWITGEEARCDGHRWRRRAGAVLTGIGTVLGDDPRLDVRLVPAPRQPLRVVADSGLRLPPTARILAPPGSVLVVTACADPGRADALRARGAEVLLLADAEHRVDLTQVVDELGRRQVNELHLEAGATLGGAMLRAGLVDELLVYCAPILIGDGAPLAALGGLPDLASAPRFRFESVERVGDDLRLRWRRPTEPVPAGG